MHFLTNPPIRLLSLGLVAASALFFSGCGGGGDDGQAPTAPILAPNNLFNSVLVINYGDGRSFTFTITDASASGISRSDGTPITAWDSTGQGTSVLFINVAYGAFTTEAPANLDNVFDSYGMVFTTKTTGTVAIKEDVTSNTFNDTSVPVLSGTFTFTTYPPTG